MIRHYLRRLVAVPAGKHTFSANQEGLSWLFVCRLGLLGTLLLFTVIQQVFHQPHLDSKLLISYSLLTGAFFFNFLFALVAERFDPPWGYVIFQVAFDVTLTSFWVYFSRDANSLFALLYLIQILFVSLIFFQRGALVASVFSSLGLGLVLFSNRMAIPSFFSSWVVFSLIFWSLGFVGGYLSEELSRTTATLKEKQRRFEGLANLYRRIISDMPTGLMMIDKEMKIQFINPAGANILQVVASDYSDKSLAASFPDLLPFFTQLETENIEENEEQSSDIKLEATVASPGDTHRTFFMEPKAKLGKARLQQTVEIRIANQRKLLRGDVAQIDSFDELTHRVDIPGGGRLLLFQEVTKLVHLEEKLKQHEKLAAVGQLAAGIAHEIRNPLTSMSASIELLKGGIPDNVLEAENRKLMDIVVREIDRLNQLITEFLDFVKPERLKKEKIHLSEVLTELLVAAQSNFPKDIQIQLLKSLDDKVQVIGDPQKIKQVFWNLLLNAIQAMDKAGTIEVGCQWEGKHRAKIWVSDQGAGMTDEVMGRLFEPFFTTKDRGTGLGLATAYKIVEAHQGEIRVQSKVGQGTRFDVFFAA